MVTKDRLSVRVPLLKMPPPTAENPPPPAASSAPDNPSAPRSLGDAVLDDDIIEDSRAQVEDAAAE